MHYVGAKGRVQAPHIDTLLIQVPQRGIGIDIATITHRNPVRSGGHLIDAWGASVYRRARGRRVRCGRRTSLIRCHQAGEPSK